MLLVVGGMVEAANVPTISFYYNIGSSTATTTLTTQDATTLGIIGVIFGVVMMASGYMLYSNPKEHVPWGAIVLILSFLSIFTSLGGLIIGIFLGGIGGIKGIRWQSDAEIWQSYPQEAVRYFGATSNESDRIFAIYNESGLDGVVNYLVTKDPDLTSAEAIPVAIRIIAERDKLLRQANEQKLKSFPSNESTTQQGTNTERSEEEANTEQEKGKKKSWIDRWLQR